MTEQRAKITLSTGTLIDLSMQEYYELIGIIKSMIKPVPDSLGFYNGCENNPNVSNEQFQNL